MRVIQNILFTQFLLNAGSLKLEHQHTLISYSHCNNLSEIHTHSNQWGTMNSSPRLSLQVRETAGWARELSASCKEGSLEPAGQQGRRCPQSSRANAKGDQCGEEQNSGVWSSAISAVVWSLPQLYFESSMLHPSGYFCDKCMYHSNVLVSLMLSGEFAQEPMGGPWLFLTALLASVEFPQEPTYGWSRSADTATLTTRADVSPCQMCLF